MYYFSFYCVWFQLVCFADGRLVSPVIAGIVLGRLLLVAEVVPSFKDPAKISKPPLFYLVLICSSTVTPAY